MCERKTSTRINMEAWKQKSHLLEIKQMAFRMLSYADSNHDKQNQNLLCYHYTIRQAFHS